MPISKTWIPILVAAAGFTVAILAQQTRLARLTNVAIPADFLEVHVTSKIGDPGRCLISDRGDAAVRRSEPELQSARWRCEERAPDREGELILAALDGKRASFLFVPYRHVVDPAWPLLYEELRQGAGEAPLPRLRWVHLHQDRVYRGFYLQASLPSNDFVQENKLGRLEIQAADGADAACFDRKLRNVCPIYSFLVSESILPAVAYTPALARLDALLPADLPRHFLVEEKAAVPMRPWPLPFDLRDLLEDDAHPVAMQHDERFRRWRASAAEPAPLPGLALPEAAVLRSRLESALEASCRVTPCDDGDRRRLAESPTLRWLESPR